MNPKMYFYRFPRLASRLEAMTSYRVDPAQGVVGLQVNDLLGLAMGIGARRHYPYGYFLVLPQPPVPTLPPEVLPEDESSGPGYF